MLEISNFDTAGWVSIFIALYTVAAHTNGSQRSIAAGKKAAVTIKPHGGFVMTIKQ